MLKLIENLKYKKLIENFLKTLNLKDESKKVEIIKLFETLKLLLIK
jgi:hypothetical protein